MMLVLRIQLLTATIAMTIILMTMLMLVLAAMMMLVLAVGCCFEIWSRGRSKPLKD